MTGDGEHDRLRALEAVTDAALAHLRVDDLLPELLDRVREVLGTDTAAILMLDPEGKELVARAARGLEEEVERGVRIPVGGGFAGRVVAEMRPVTIDDVDHADVLNPLLREKGVKSLLGVPLVVAGSPIGVLHVGTLTPRIFGMPETRLLQFVADRAALAIEHARAFEAEYDARREAERALRRLSDLQRVTDAALGPLSLDELLDELLARVSEMLSTDTAAILLVDPVQEALVTRAARGIEGEAEQAIPIPIGRGFAGRVAAAGRPVVVEDVDQAEILSPILRASGVRSMVGVPLLAEDSVVGVLHVGSVVPRTFTADEVGLLSLVADRAAVAIDRARVYEREHGIAETLQRSLLPERVPSFPATRIAVRYLPPPAAAAVGGDWYDAFALRDGMLGIAIGDVVGRGLPAAALMGQVRNALRALALDGREPETVMTGLNRLVRGLEPGRTATALYLVHDPDTGRTAFASAGHMAPLVIRPGAAPEFPELRGSPPLGATRSPVYRPHELALEPGTRVVVFTDGLVESRELSLEDGLERLAVRAAALPADPEAAADHLLADPLLGVRADDTALVVLDLLPLGDELATEFPAEPDSVPAMRRLLGRWLRDVGADEEAAYDLKVCASEATANAIEHAYAPGDEATVEFRGQARDGEISVEVRDHGGWRDPRGSNRGRGLALMEALMDSFDIEQDDRGTRVVLRRRACRDGAAS